MTQTKKKSLLVVILAFVMALTLGFGIANLSNGTAVNADTEYGSVNGTFNFYALTNSYSSKSNQDVAISNSSDGTFNFRFVTSSSTSNTGGSEAKNKGFQMKTSALAFYVGVPSTISITMGCGSTGRTGYLGKLDNGLSQLQALTYSNYTSNVTEIASASIPNGTTLIEKNIEAGYYQIYGTGSNSWYIVKMTVTPSASYSVTYYANNGTEASSEAEGSQVAANTFTYSGYRFTGWNTAADGTGTAYAAGASVTSNLTLYAQWAKLYNLAYNANEGTGTMEGASGISGESVTVAANGFTAPASHKFVGWNTAADGEGTAYAAGASLTFAEADVTLYAQWEETVFYTVTLKYNNGEEDGSMQVEAGDTAQIADPVRENWTFAGWKVATLAGDAYAGGAVTADVTLVASYTRDTISAEGTAYTLVSGKTYTAQSAIGSGYNFGLSTSGDYLRFQGNIKGTSSGKLYYIYFTVPAGYAADVSLTSNTAENYLGLWNAEDLTIEDTAITNFSVDDAKITVQNANDTVTNLPSGTYYVGSTSSGHNISLLTVTLKPSIYDVTLAGNAVKALAGEKVGNLFAEYGIENNLPENSLGLVDGNGAAVTDDTAVENGAVYTFRMPLTINSLSVAISSAEVDYGTTIEEVLEMLPAVKANGTEALLPEAYTWNNEYSANVPGNYTFTATLNDASTLEKYGYTVGAENLSATFTVTVAKCDLEGESFYFEVWSEDGQTLASVLGNSVNANNEAVAVVWDEFEAGDTTVTGTVTETAIYAEAQITANINYRYYAKSFYFGKYMDAAGTTYDSENKKAGTLTISAEAKAEMQQAGISYGNASGFECGSDDMYYGLKLTKNSGYFVIRLKKAARVIVVFGGSAGVGMTLGEITYKNDSKGMVYFIENLAAGEYRFTATSSQAVFLSYVIIDNEDNEMFIPTTGAAIAPAGNWTADGVTVYTTGATMPVAANKAIATYTEYDAKTAIPEGYTMVGWYDGTALSAANIELAAAKTYTAVYAKFAWEGVSVKGTTGIRFQGNVEFYKIADEDLLDALREAMSVTITVYRTYDEKTQSLIAGLNEDLFGLDANAKATAAANSICFRYAIVNVPESLTATCRFTATATVSVNGVALTAANSLNSYTIAEVAALAQAQA